MMSKINLKTSISLRVMIFKWTIQINFNRKVNYSSIIYNYTIFIVKWKIIVVIIINTPNTRLDNKI